MASSSAPRRRPGGIAALAQGLAVLLILATICGTFANLAGPHRIPWFQDWSESVEAQARELGIRLAETREVRRILEAGTHLAFDTRPERDYEAGHLPGALPLPEDEFDLRVMDYLPLLYPEQPLLVYCSGSSCDTSLLVSRYLADKGLTNIVLFAGGTRAWTEAGYELVTTP